MRFRNLVPLLLLIALVVAACGPAATQEATAVPEAAADTETAATTVAEAGEEEAVVATATPQEAEAAPPTEAPATIEEATAPSEPPAAFQGLDYTTTESGLQIAITEEGSGEQAEAGDVVRVHYRGLLADGTEFDSSMDGDDPFSFMLGQGKVIPGWDEGIAMLQEGAQAKLIIPPQLAYGEQGSGPIPPNATLYFEVELVDILAGGPAEPIAVDEGEYETTESGLQYYVIEEGSGESPEDGDPVQVHYTLWLDDGTRVDSSLDRAEPVVFLVGSQQVFPGWNEGVAAMKVGGKRQFHIPPELALGETGAGTVIPPNSPLILQVELLDILPGGPAVPAAVAEDEYVETESGLQYHDLESGSGAEVEEGDTVSVHYTGWLEDGTKFDSSFARGEPITLQVGAGQVIPGWEEGLVGMQEGGVRQLVIPPDLAYGEPGRGPIPPNATLIFEVELLEIR